MAQIIDRHSAVSQAAAAWQGAPLHIKAMAGDYVGPILEALQLMSQEMDALQAARCCNEGENRE